MSNSDFGPFSELVRIAGALIAAALAISFSWRTRSKKEPSEEDIPKAPQQVAGLATAVLIGILWYYAKPEGANLLVTIAILLLSITAISSLIYSYLLDSHVFFIKIFDKNGNVIERPVIGGFALTPRAKEYIMEKGEGIQQYFHRTSFDPKLVWTNQSRVLAKFLFILSYLIMVVCGTLSLAIVAIIISFNLS